MQYQKKKLNWSMSNISKDEILESFVQNQSFVPVNRFRKFKY